MPKGIKGFQKGQKFTNEHRLKMSQKAKGKLFSEETRKKLRDKRAGRKPTLGKKLPHSEATKKKIGLATSRWQKGRRSHNWKGGISSEAIKIRTSIEYSLWRNSVFSRDSWTCQKYGIKGGKLTAHHIKNFSQFPELRFAIDNGITLSEKAHKEFHKKYGVKNNTKEQMDKFLTNN